MRSIASAFRPPSDTDVDATIDAVDATIDATAHGGSTPGSAGPARVDLASSTSVEEGPRYAVKSVLGRGGMGEVRLCRDGRIGRDVAIKVAHTVSAAEQARARFLREARVQGQLEHPAIVPVYDLEIFDDGSAYFAMKRVRGRTLAAILADIQRRDEETVKRFPRRKLLAVLGSVCLAVDFAHRKGVVHRDIKPGNIMIGDFGEVYLLDWGLAKVVGHDDADETIDTGAAGEQDATGVGSVLGTPGYMAPEQIDAALGELSPACDIFALGAVLFEIIAGERYINGRDANAAILLTLHGDAERRPSVRTQGRVSSAFDDICTRTLELSPQKRMQSARELHDAIDTYLAGEHDLERRRVASTAHLEDARRCADTVEGRAKAMRELGRALTLDPQNIDAQRELLRLMKTLPSTTPDDVRQKVLADEERRIRGLARLRMFSGISYLPFIPLLLWLGVNNWMVFGLTFACVVISAAMNAFIMRRGDRHRVIQVATHAIYLAGTFGLALVAGPLVLVPAVLVGYTVEFQMHPHAGHRSGTLIASSAVLTAAFFLDRLGVVGPSYSFVDNGILIHEGMTELNQAALVLLFVASLVTIITPSLFMAKTRDELARAEQQLHLQQWQLEQIVPPEATRA